MVAREPALRDDEVRVLRAIVAEYRFEQERSRVWRGRIGAGRIVIVTAVGLAMLALQVISVYLAATHGATP